MKKNKDSIILGIESSCDDTSAAILKNGVLLSNITASQGVHQKFGGVVPELASRAHQENIVPTVDAAIKEAGIEIKDITAIAFTRGPGLLGSLLVGTSFAKSLSMSLNIPLLDVHHMKAHVHAHFIQEKNIDYTPPSFPFICLTVSGGHTQIVYVENPLKMKVIGETIDDAIGEAFDKAGKLLGLGYPAGPLIDKHAMLGDSNKYQFTYPKANALNYSFSGLKTQFLYFLNKNIKENANFINENLQHICASYQSHLINYLLINFKKALKKYPCNDIAIAGGVSANSHLRKKFTALGKELKCKVHIPKMSFCTDNAAMIAMSGFFLEKEGKFSDLEVSASARITMN